MLSNTLTLDEEDAVQEELRTLQEEVVTLFIFHVWIIIECEIAP